MRKMWILLIVLMVVGLPMFAADTAIKGNFLWMGNLDLDGADDASMLKARQKFDTKVDDNNQVYVEIRWDNGLAPDQWNPAGARIKAFKLTTDLIGALGLDLPVSVKVEAGVWESDFMNWWYATQAGWEYVNAAQYDQQQSQGAARLNVGFGPVTVYAYHSFLDANGPTAFGAEGAVGPVGIEASYYKDSTEEFADGSIAVEAKFAQDVGRMSVSVYPAFNYNLGAETYAWDISLGSTYQMVGLVLGFQGETDTVLRKVVAELNVKPVENVGLWATLYMDLHDTAVTSAFQGLDIMASYQFGAAKFLLGYMLGGDDGTLLPVFANNTAYANGLYAGIDCSF